MNTSESENLLDFLAAFMSTKSKCLFSASSENKIFVISTEKLSVLTSLPSEDHTVSSLSWNASNEMFAFSCSNNTLMLSYSKAPQAYWQFAEKGDQYLVKFLRTKNDQIVSGGTRSVSMLWQVSGKHVLPVRAFKHIRCVKTTAITTDPSDALFAIGGHDENFKNYLYVFDLVDNHNARSFHNFESTTSVCNSIEFSTSNVQHFGCTTNDGRFFLFDLDSKVPIMCIPNESGAAAKGLFFLPHERNHVVIPFADNSISVYDMLYRKWQLHVPLDHGISSFAAMEDGVGILTGSPQGRIYYYDIRNPSYSIDSISLNCGPITCLSVQKGVQVMPESLEFTHFYESDLSISAIKERNLSGQGNSESYLTKFKRRMKDRKTEASAHMKGGTNQLKDNIKTLFASPLGKKPKVEHIHFSDSMSFDEAMAVKAFPNSSDNSVSPSANRPMLLHTERKSVEDENSVCFTGSDDFATKGGASQTQNNIKGEQNSATVESYSIKSLQHFVHSEIRNLHLNVVREIFDQTNFLTNHLETSLNCHSVREQQLLEENIRLRDEVTYLRNLVQSMKTQSNNGEE